MPMSSVEAASQNTRVFISYRSQPPDSSLAEEFYTALKAAGYQPFMAAKSIRLGENWPQRIDEELEQTDYFVLLLSEKSVVSEMVTEEVRRARELRDRCFEAIAKPGSLIRVKAPRQMGKTSLMARILNSAEAKGCLKVPLSFQLADGKVFADLDKFLQWFCASIGRRLRVPNKLADYWDEIFGSKDNCTAYFEEYLLAEIDQPLALGLDEVDLVFEHPEIASDFFAMLRAWHEEAKNREIWKKLRLVVVHSTEVYIPMSINQSPFNVGLPVELPEFTSEQVQDLARRHGLNWNATQVEQLMAVVGGHPFLVRLALYNIARQDMTLEELLQEAPTEAGIYGDHLRRHLWNLQQRPELVEAVKQLVGASKPVRLESVQGFQLESMGIGHLQGNEVIPRCDLYRRVFIDVLLWGGLLKTV